METSTKSKKLLMQDLWMNLGSLVSSRRPLQPSFLTKCAGTLSRLSRIISGIDEADAAARYNLEEKDNQIKDLPNSSSTSVHSVRRQIISWARNDPENPYNWSSVCHYESSKWRLLSRTFQLSAVRNMGIRRTGLT